MTLAFPVYRGGDAYAPFTLDFIGERVRCSVSFYCSKPNQRSFVIRSNFVAVPLIRRTPKGGSSVRDLTIGWRPIEIVSGCCTGTSSIHQTTWHQQHVGFQCRLESQGAHGSLRSRKGQDGESNSFQWAKPKWKGG